MMKKGEKFFEVFDRKASFIMLTGRYFFKIKLFNAISVHLMA
jgi:hypothetical protein